MTYLPVVGIALGLVLCCYCQPQYQPRPTRQYNNGPANDESEQYNYQRTPPPQILTHKQALNHDGNFKYLFTSENGLAQGESIAPDGSRNGGYSYVDPTGRKISVKYTAGKEGFRIIEADHLPKAPQPIAPLPAAQQHAPQAYRPQPQPYNLPRGAQDDGQYRPHQYERPAAPLSSLPPITQARLAYPQPSASSNNVIEEKEYNDEPGKANSFGSGYIFEFSG